MSRDNDRSEHLQRLEEQYISVLKRRQTLEKEYSRIKQQQLTNAEELGRLEEESVTYDAALQKSQKEWSELQCQAAKVEMCRKMERVRTEARLKVIGEHREQFNELFARERRLAEHRYRQQCERERAELERERERESELAGEARSRLEAADAVEAECDQLERECAALKNRNKAILLLLRKNVVEAENRRKNLMQRRQLPSPP